MVAHKKPLGPAQAGQRARTFVVVWVLLLVVSGSGRTVGGQTHPPQRIVSLIPSVTEMLFAMGVGPQVIGVSNFDQYPPEVQTRAKVGGLIDPDIERILSLKPDLIIVYGTQTELREQMQRAGVPIYPYEHAGLSDITSTMRALGRRVGSEAAATALASRIDADIAEVRRRVAGKPRPRTLLVFGRDSETLRGIYASGGVGFLHDMLEAAGAVNVFADVKRQSVQAASELVLTRAPDVILEIRDRGRPNLRAWEALGSIPAVRAHRIYLLTGDDIVNPGPRVAQAVRRIAETLHPDAFK
jgi:iron complex transport system substrate-binding protein